MIPKWDQARQFDLALQELAWNFRTFSLSRNLTDATWSGSAGERLSSCRLQRFVRFCWILLCTRHSAPTQFFQPNVGP